MYGPGGSHGTELLPWIDVYMNETLQVVDLSGVAAMVYLFCILAVFSSTDKCRTSWWTATTHALSTIIRQFEGAHGRLPTDAEGLQVLYERPVNWPAGQPWTPLLDGIPRDRWGHELRYRTLPGHLERFGFYSLGRDGVSSSLGNDADDLNSWNTDHPWVSYYDKLELNRKHMRHLWYALISLTAGIVVFLSFRRATVTIEP